MTEQSAFGVADGDHSSAGVLPRLFSLEGRTALITGAGTSARVMF
jgi:hypothetical protein